MTKYNKLVISRILKFMSIRCVFVISMDVNFFPVFVLNKAACKMEQKARRANVYQRQTQRKTSKLAESTRQWCDSSGRNTKREQQPHTKTVPPLTWTDLLHHTQDAAGYAHRMLIDLFIFHCRYKTLIICVRFFIRCLRFAVFFLSFVHFFFSVRSECATCIQHKQPEHQ